MERHPSISESEWQVMKTIWAGPPKTLQDILSQLAHTGWSTTTIQTYLARLVKKKVLRTERQGKGYLYYPAVTEKECQLAEGKDFLGRIYDGSLARMVSGFVKSGSLTEDELQELKTLLEQSEKEM